VSKGVAQTVKAQNILDISIALLSAYHIWIEKIKTQPNPFKNCWVLLPVVLAK
jgi:hypothetical protein